MGETIRNGWNAEAQSQESGFPVDEIKRGLWPAVLEFLSKHPEWVLEARYTNNNGLTILRRVQTPKVLVLVIANSHHPVYDRHRQFWRDTPKHPNVDVRFLECDPQLAMPTVRGDTFFTPGRECYEAILRKTLDAFEYFLTPGHPYQWVVRTNLSSH